MNRTLGIVAAYGVALAAALGIARLLAPAAWLEDLGLAEPPPAQTSGWGAAASAPAAAAEPLIPLGWMAWTPETGAFFLFILFCLAMMTAREMVAPGGHPRQGVLGLETTRGDRLFISLLGSAWILLLWLGIAGAPIWGGAALALLWAAFVFWKV